VSEGAEDAKRTPPPLAGGGRGEGANGPRPLREGRGSSFPRSDLPTTVGHLLNGRIRYAQPTTGFRSGIEPVLLAATIPARPGERVVEGGTGAGAALLCLTTRVPGLTGFGIEIDPDQIARARDNAIANDMPSLTFIAGSVETDIPDTPFDHAFANPPYHLAPGTASPDASRSRAKAGSATLLEDWARALAKPLKHRGTLTFILPAASLPACLAAMAAADCAVSAIFPLWPKAGVAAKLTIVRGVKGGRGTPSLLPGLVLHTPDGPFTAEADAILRNGDALPLG